MRKINIDKTIKEIEELCLNVVEEQLVIQIIKDNIQEILEKDNKTNWKDLYCYIVNKYEKLLNNYIKVISKDPIKSMDLCGGLNSFKNRTR